MAKKIGSSDNFLYEVLQVTQIIGIGIMFVGAILVGALYTHRVLVNWDIAQAKIDDEILKRYEEIELSDSPEDLLLAWNDALNTRNEIDKTHFNALRDGFFGVGILTSLAAFLSTLKPRKREDNSENVLFLDQKQFDDIIKHGAVDFKFEIAPASPLLIRARNAEDSSEERLGT